MTETARPFAEKKYIEIKGRRMAYIDEGYGSPIVFQHGNPTSSFLWRNVMPACRGLGRLIACDLVGMGDSDKVIDSGSSSYSLSEHREYLFALWEELRLGNEVVLVLHDWGSALGFDWACQNQDRVQGIAYMEAIVMPMEWSDISEPALSMIRELRSPEGERLILDDNLFVEQGLPAMMLRQLQDAEMAYYRKPFLNPGEDRRPTLSWPRQIPLGGTPAEVVSIVERYATWLAQSDVPKLYVHVEPGRIDTGRLRGFCRRWPNQTEVTVRGEHFVQEDSPEEIGAAVADFVRRLRQSSLPIE